MNNVQENTQDTSPFSAPKANLETQDAHEDGPFKLNLFSPKGRLGRMRFFTFSYALMFAFSILIAIFVMVFAATAFDMSKVSFSAIIPIVLLSIIWVYLTIMLIIKRLHDMNASGWWILMPLGLLFGLGIISGILASRNPSGSATMVTLMTLISPLSTLVIGAILTLMPGTKGKNRFGSVPPPNGIGVKIGFYILLALAALSIINTVNTAYKLSQTMKANSQLQQQHYEFDQ